MFLFFSVNRNSRSYHGFSIIGTRDILDSRVVRSCAYKLLFALFLCAVKKVKNSVEISMFAFCDSVLAPFSLMAPLSKQKRHLKRVALLLRKPPSVPQPSGVHDAIELVPCSEESSTNPINDESEAIDENLDSWVECFDETQIDNICAKSWLQWNEGAGKQFRKVYDGTGRSSKFAKRAEKNRREHLMSQSRNLHSYFGPAVNLSSEDCPEEEPEKDEAVVEYLSNSSVNAAIEKLRSIVRITSNKRADKHTPDSKFEFLRHLAVLRFLEKIQETPRSRVSASKNIAEQMFGGGENRAKSIRNWSD